jgi:predicted nuclease with TOPRIM domain
MNTEELNELLTLINELQKHIRRVEKARKTLTGANAERATWTISNLRQRIAELEEAVP